MYSHKIIFVSNLIINDTRLQTLSREQQNNIFRFPLKKIIRLRKRNCFFSKKPLESVMIICLLRKLTFTQIVLQSTILKFIRFHEDIMSIQDYQIILKTVLINYNLKCFPKNICASIFKCFFFLVTSKRFFF